MSEDTYGDDDEDDEDDKDDEDDEDDDDGDDDDDDDHYGDYLGEEGHAEDCLLVRFELLGHLFLKVFVKIS